MRRLICFYILLALILPACLGAIADPIVDISDPNEDDVINNNVFTVTGTAAGSDGKILQTTEANFRTGTHEDTTATESGDLVIFPMPDLVKQNNGDPVLIKGGDGTFDDERVTTPTVIILTGTYHMWYTGNDGNNNRIGYATSADGIAWTRMNGGSFVLDKGAVDDWDSFGVSDPWVIEDSGTWKMWFTGSDGLKTRIGYATSADGVTWNKDGSEVLDLGEWNKFDNDGVSSPTVLKIGSTYHMWYIGNDGSEKQLGYATSNDGTHWTRQNVGNPVFSHGSMGAFDGVGIGGPAVFELNDVYKLYYTGESGSKGSIGLAISVNGIDWLRQNNGNPVLDTTNGKFDWKSIHNPAIFLDGSVERMWYGGQNSTTHSLGYATGTISSVGGIYTSPPFEIGGNVEFGTINWTTDTPAGTSISVEARTQPKNQNWGGWFTPTNGADLGQPDGWRFMYRLTMTSDDIIKTPAFQDLTLNFYKPIVKVEASTNGVLWNTCDGTTTWTCTVEGVDGDALVRARSIDSTGDHSTLSYINITINGDLPQGTVLINDDDDFSNSLNIVLTLNATDSTEVSSMMISEDPDFVGASWISYSTSAPFTLSEGDGWKNVNVRFKDLYGIESDTVNDSIELDMTPPNGSITIDGGASYTTDLEVVLTMEAYDKNGITGMMISDDPTFSGHSPKVFYDNEKFDLSKNDGEKTVHVRYFDPAGNYGQYSATIILDTTPPTGTLKINSNAAVTITRMVNLTMDGKDKNEIVEMMVSNLDTFNDTTWEPYSKYKLWELTHGSGSKVVFVKFKDEAGLEGKTYSDNIVYEVPPDEGIIVINEGAEFTNDTNVTLRFGIGGLGTVTDMMVSNLDDLKDAEWQVFQETLDWEMLTGDGIRYVYVKFLTLIGIETEGFADNITLDTAAPTLTFMEPTNGTTHKKSLVQLRIRALDTRGVEKVEVQVDDLLWEEAMVNATDNDHWELEVQVSGKGPHEIRVRGVDPAGNTNEETITIYYKPKKKKDSPFLDVGLVALALMVALVMVARSRRR